jgi:AhpD family alkylhydroperoxidase
MITTVPSFPHHTPESAPDASKPALQTLKQAIGMVPNLAAAMAESPELIGAFVAVRGIYQSGTFTPAEREVISLTNAVENGCVYCRAVHATFALGAGVSAETVRGLRQSELPADPKLNALAAYARAVLRGRGKVEAHTLSAFYGVGYTPAQALEVLVALAVSVIANYAEHLIHPELDAPLRAQG